MNTDSQRMLKHEIRTPMNHIVGYSELLMEAASEDGIDVIAAQAKSLYDDGQKLAAQIEKHFAAWSNVTLEQSLAALKFQITALVEDVIEKSSSFMKTAKDPWAKDFSRVMTAANQLASILEGLSVAGGRTGGHDSSSLLLV